MKTFVDYLQMLGVIALAVILFLWRRDKAELERITYNNTLRKAKQELEEIERKIEKNDGQLHIAEDDYEAAKKRYLDSRAAYLSKFPSKGA